MPYEPDPNRLAIDTSAAPAVIDAFVGGAPLPDIPPYPGVQAESVGGEVTAC